MTGADILDRMAMLDAELETTAGGADETKGLLAIDSAQDYFESLASTYPHVFGTTGNVTTTAATEATTYPSGVLRLDSVWYLDTTQTPNIPTYQLTDIKKVGGHIPSLPWPYRQAARTAGSPDGYWTDERNFYWSPVPDATYTIRWYGMQAQASFTARTIALAYPDHLAMPFATFGVRLLKMGLEDDSDTLKALADELFAPALRRARRFSRETPAGRVYSRIHVT